MIKVFSRNFLMLIIVTLLYQQVNIGCKKKSEFPDPISDSSTTNKPPDQFTLSLLTISSDSATISWTQSVDPDHDSVTYKILINDTLKISNYTGLTYLFTNLKQLTSYNIKVVAVDSKQNEITQILTITTTRYWLTFLKKLEYGAITGYSSQKCGQMIKSNDGNGYIIVGESEISDWPYGAFRMFTMKIDTMGNKLWQKYYDHVVGNSHEIKIVSARNKAYVISGGSNLMNIDNNGDIIWYDSTSSPYDVINGICINNAGEIYTVGEESFDSSINVSEGTLSKYDPSGNLLWNKKFSPSIYDLFVNIKIDKNDQLILLGSTEGTNISLYDYLHNNGVIPYRFDFWVAKLTEDGNLIWSNSYHNDYGFAFPEDIIETKEGNFVFTGHTFGTYDISYFYLQMIDGSGNSIWSYFTQDSHTTGSSVAETADNSLIVAGGYSLTYSSQSALYKFDKNGNKIWEKLYEEFATYLSNKTVIPTSDGGYITNCAESKVYNSAGETDQIYIIKTNDVGDF